MAIYRIVCTVQVPAFEPKSHAHIVKVGMEDDSGNSQLWTLEDVLDAMDRGDSFHTQSSSTGKIAAVRKVPCPLCGLQFILRSDQDAIRDNNLDALPGCKEPS